MPIEAVIFDMDGVIIASEDYWWESRVEWATALGKTWTHDDQRASMGRNTVEWAEVMRDRLQLDGMPLPQIMADVTGLVVRRIEAHLPVLPGALEAVLTAASRYRVALASGSPTAVIQKVMTLTGLDKIFEVMVFGDDMPRGKPFPDIYLEAARQLGVEPIHCVGIED
jgi:beta-phosphoglucomutase-like phosphatase (HAD superfamily)